MRITIRHIATELGVSSATVSRVLNGQGHDFIGAETRRKVLEAARELGYRPNAAARSLVTGRTNVAALWLHNGYGFSAFVGQVVHSMMAQVQETSTELLVAYIDQPDRPGSNVLPSGHWPVDGIVAHEAPHYVGAHLASGRERGCPIVGMGCWYHREADYVAVDLTAGVRDAIVHLLETSTDGVAYLVNPLSNTPGEPRYDTYHRVMDDAGVEPQTIICDRQSRASARAAIRDRCAAGRMPSALFCHNDDLALGAYRSLVELGIRVPEDVAIVGCDGIEGTEYTSCSLSTIVQPVDEMCRLAWQTLQARLDTPDAPRQETVLEARLCIRESSRMTGAYATAVGSEDRTSRSSETQNPVPVTHHRSHARGDL